jgi:serine/threonine protein kinase
MKQCQNCYRFLSSHSDRCLYCTHKNIKDLIFEFSSYNSNYKIYTHEIIVDDQALTIIKSIGRGGFGRVLKVLHNTDKKFYAIKVPLIFDEIFSNQKGKSDKEIKKSQEFLENEINTLTSVTDETFIQRFKKGILRTSVKGRDTRFPVLIMELADCTLEEIIKYVSIKGGNRIPFAEKVKIIKESVNAISHLHSLGVLHRDLSPDNLFAADREDKITYVLGDFGASKSLFEMEAGTQSSEVVGHNAYLDPCRYNRKYNRDFRLDIYSLGIIITEILMGRFWTDVMGRENIHDFLAVDFEKEFLLQSGTKYITADLIEVLRKAVKRDIEERYGTVDEFRQALFTVLDAHPEEMVTEYTAPNTITFPFYFTIKLPFELVDTTFSQEIIKFEEEEKIVLPDYRGAKILFSGFFPKKVKIKNTGLYSAVISGNAILLNFLNSKYMEIEKLIEEFEEDVAGELNFKGIIEIEKVS